jgi:hypothetical protein
VGVTSFLEGAAGLMVDLATAWAAASIAVACAAATGSRSGGLALGVAGTAGFALGAALLAWPIREGLSALGGAAGPGVFREEAWWQEPAVWDHLRFSWAFAAAYCLAAWAVSRLAVKAAGRRLRSLVAA